ncbi:MAG TPA: hydantoinase/oxoprolinase family protein [Streptosporangiaceae bacterium]|jgi:N-methylhydantoinase A
MAFILGVDVGGTFTDVCAVAPDGVVHTAKAPSTPQDLTRGVLAGLTLVAGQAGLSLPGLLRQTSKFAHGTTQTSNVIFTWTGAVTGLITTQGFADEILIMRARGRVAGVGLAGRRHLRATAKPPQIVPRHRIAEIAERVDHRGRVLVAADRADIAAAVDQLLAAGVEAIAVSLLWAHENPAHELLAAEVIAERAPGVHVSLSHRLAAVTGEYERTATAVVNAFVAPTVERYLQRLGGQLAGLGMTVPLLILQASGGVMAARATTAVHTIESGPAAGMVAVSALSRAVGQPNVIATDVGGTTFKAGLLVNGEWQVARETIINQYSLILPMIDLVSIGAGGGSIAWADGGRLRIGPRSAGSEPGPACYGWGGTEPTVTDADLVLGFLDPDTFLSGTLKLHKDLAEKAIRQAVADPLFGGDVVAAAAGIRQVVDAQMGDLVHKVTIERGHDPRDFAMAAYGGSGPLHAAGYGSAIGIGTIIVPHAATAYSAYGAAASDVRHYGQRSVPAGLLGDDAALRAAYAALERAGRQVVSQQAVTPAGISSTRWADMRFERQLHDVRVPLGGADAPVTAASMAAAFTARYRALFGANAVLPDARPVLLRIGVETTGVIAKPCLPLLPRAGGDPASALRARRPVYWPELGGWQDTPVYDGTRLTHGHQVTGHAVIEQPGTTVVVPAGARAAIDGHGNTVITLAAGPGQPASQGASR